MTTYIPCPRCHHAYATGSECRCKRFEVCVPEWDGEGSFSDQWSRDPEDAATEYVEERDTENDALKRAVAVIVRCDDGNEMKFMVEAEAEVSYTAFEIE